MQQKIPKKKEVIIEEILTPRKRGPPKRTDMEIKIPKIKEKKKYEKKRNKKSETKDESMDGLTGSTPVKHRLVKEMKKYLKVLMRKVEKIDVAKELRMTLREIEDND